MNIRSYSELSKLGSFSERFEYLKIGSRVGDETFGYNRVLNQSFYKSKEWERARDYVIVRDTIGDYCCDLGAAGHPILNGSRIIIHHMNPITIEDIQRQSRFLLDPEFLIATIHRTHNAIHYGDESQIQIDQPIIRTPNDMCPWK